MPDPRNGGQLVVANKQTLRSMLNDERFQAQLASVLPTHLTPTRMASLALLAVTQMPKLLETSPKSIIKSIMAASVTGLEFNGPLGHAYLVPFKGECTFMPGYRGLIDLAVRGGGVIDAQSHIVFECDEFDLSLGSKPFLHHKPDLKKRAELRAQKDVALEEYAIGAYFYGLLPDGKTPHTGFMATDEILRRKRVSQTGGRSDSPWNVWPEEMFKKTPVRHEIKFISISNERIQLRLGAAAEFDNRMETGEVSALIPEFDDEATLEARIIEKTSESAEDLRKQLDAKTEQLKARVAAEKGAPPLEQPLGRQVATVEADDECAAIQTEGKDPDDLFAQGTSETGRDEDYPGG